MITKKCTQATIEEWKRVYERVHKELKPNRLTGVEVDAYFRNKYLFQYFDSNEFKEIVEFSINHNVHSKKKLPMDVKPDIQSYKVDSVLVGIDLVSGEFHVECEDIDKAIPIYDDLFVYRGLDVDDINNYVMCAEYVRLKKDKQ